MYNAKIDKVNLLIEGINVFGLGGYSYYAAFCEG